MIHRTHSARLIAGAVAVLLLVVAALRLLPRSARAGQAYAVPQVGRVYSVTQFVQPGTGPLWTTKRPTFFLIHGVLRPAPMQPVADYVLTDNGANGAGEGGLALATGPRDAMMSSLLRVAILRPVLPHTPDNPVLGVPATYSVLWTGCPSNGCSHSPWQLASSGQ
jgi:hypothetical protein